MKKVITILILLLTTHDFFGQTEIKPDNNSTVIRLIILNEKGEVLIKKASIGWITIDTFFEKRQTINEVIDSLSNKYGVSIEAPSLKGLFTYKFNFKNTSSIRQLYLAKSTTNELPTNKNVEFYWVSKEEAVEKLKNTIPSLGEMVNQILDYPEIVWGGSFYVTRDNGVLNSTQTEDFYSISNPSNYKIISYSSIEKTLQNYMEGSSYNKLEMLESAFTTDATLYLTGRDGQFRKYTPKEYVAFFKNGKKGEFNGRSTKVLKIDVEKDIATAKVEIVGPNRKWVYIDLFLLKKFKNRWKIISKTATRVDDKKNN